MFLLDFLKRKGPSWAENIESKHFLEYSQLLGMYAAAITNGTVTRKRNSLAYAIAAQELAFYMKRRDANNCINHVSTCDGVIVSRIWNSNFCTLGICQKRNVFAYYFQSMQKMHAQKLWKTFQIFCIRHLSTF